ncbi:MAG TPA: hypothetical protein VGP82_23230 [Ktedonobacterales bacterium]|nr:hypothetical protein [Ktedonobacterales bacterium]
MPPTLPVGEEVQPGTASDIQLDHLGRPFGVFVGEEDISNKGAGRLARPNRPVLMGMPPIGAHLDVYRRTVGSAFEQLDRAGWCFEQEALATFGPYWTHDGIEPVGHMLGFPCLLEQLGDLLFFLQPVPHRLVDLHLEAELQRIDPRHFGFQVAIRPRSRRPLQDAPRHVL